jgi:hypothetical protein
MYKKRFAAWGFHKNSKSSAVSTPSSSITCQSDSSATPLEIPPKPPSHSVDNILMLTFLTNVQTWSLSFYESVSHRELELSSLDLAWPEQVEDINHTFKLAVDMLNRGYGSLAGRMARKAFLLLEETFTLEAPMLLWNLLEAMHYMLTQGQAQLFGLLLVHLHGLVDRRMSPNHPLPTILRSLRTWLTNNLDCSSSSPINSLSSSFGVGTSKNLSKTMSSVIEQAWIINAEILFNRFDQRLFRLYTRVHFDACSLNPPSAIISASKQWFLQLRCEQTFSFSLKFGCIERVMDNILDAAEIERLQRLFATPTSLSVAQKFETLRVTNINTLYDHARSILDQTNSTIRDKTTLLCVLATLVTVRAIKELPVATDLSEVDADLKSRISRGQVGILACAMRTLMDLDSELNFHSQLPLEIVDKLRFLVALREYAHTETDPKVVREMWVLEAALVAAGEEEQAEEVRQEAYWRMERHVQDIPVGFA